MRLRVVGRTEIYIFVNAVKTLTSDVSASLFYRVRCQDGVHTSVELCHACTSFKHNCEHSIESCNNRYKSNLLHFKVYEFETSAKMMVCQ